MTFASASGSPAPVYVWSIRRRLESRSRNARKIYAIFTDRQGEMPYTAISEQSLRSPIFSFLLFVPHLEGKRAGSCRLFFFIV
jgi:hypothetical protein